MPKPISDGQVEYPKNEAGQPQVPETVDQYARDVTAFLTWTAEPHLEARKRLGLSDAYGSCHTATVGGYVLEGHVPADEVKRLLASRPKALGLAVPGMPPSSPGMDVPGRSDPYEVLLVQRQGGHVVFARYPKAAT